MQAAQGSALPQFNLVVNVCKFPHNVSAQWKLCEHLWIY